MSLLYIPTLVREMNDEYDGKSTLHEGERFGFVDGAVADHDHDDSVVRKIGTMGGTRISCVKNQTGTCIGGVCTPGLTPAEIMSAARGKLPTPAQRRARA